MSEEKSCYVCGKKDLSKDEIGLTKKLIDKKSINFYCVDCLADYLEVTTEELLDVNTKADTKSSDEHKP